MINNLPTVYEVVTGVAKKQSKAPNGSSKSNKSGSKVSFFVVFKASVCVLFVSVKCTDTQYPALRC